MEQARNLTGSNSADATAGKTRNNANSMNVQSGGIGDGGGKSTSASASANSSASKTVSHNHSQPSQVVKGDVTLSTTPNVSGISSNKKEKLRKGKWTIEEEEYTSRIIQYFSTGLLTLPDGATLRSYLAEKLNCDPMRITKKFTGACCLGRRAYHLRDRPRASSAEVEMANYELLHLEQRFRLRVEHEQTGLPLPPRHELLPSQPSLQQPTPIIPADVLPSLFSLQQRQRQGLEAPTVNASKNPWIQHNSTTLHPNLASLLPGLTGTIADIALPGSNTNNVNNAHTANNSHLLPLAVAAQQLLLQQTSNERERASFSSPVASSSSQLQVLNNVLASLAFSKVLASQHTGLAQLQPFATGINSGNNMDAIAAAVATPKAPNNSIYATTPSTSSFSANIAINNINKSSISMPIIGTQQDHSEQVKLYQTQLEKKNRSCSTSSSTKEERTKQLKAAFEEQKRALRLAYEKSLRDAQEEESFASAPAAIVSCHSNGTASTVSTNNNLTVSKGLTDVTSPAEQLQRSYEAHLASLQRDERQEPSTRALPKAPHLTTHATSEPRIRNEGKERNSQYNKGQEKQQRVHEKTPDEEAGTILLGFLNSLRESFEDAVGTKDGTSAVKGRNGCNNRKQNNDAINTPAEFIQTGNTIEPPTIVTEDVNLSSGHRSHVNSPNSESVRKIGPNPITSLSRFQSSKRKIKPASVTETSSSTSSQPTNDQSSSSQEDYKSNSTGNSSSEESSERGSTTSRHASKGPPRKRLKGLVVNHEFTRENLMAHSKRMDMECEESASSSSCDK